MSTDPKLPDYVRSALERLRAAHPADAAPSTPALDVDGVLERVLRDLPGAAPLPELPGLSDDDWDSPDADFDPDGGDGGGGSDSGGPSSGDPAGGGDVQSPGDLGSGPDGGVDLLPDAAGTGSLVSLLAAPISLGKALLTLALPAALVGGMLATVAVDSRRAEVDSADAAETSNGRGTAQETVESADIAGTLEPVSEGRGPEAVHPAATSTPQQDAVAGSATAEPASLSGGSGGAAAVAPDLGVVQDTTPQDTLPAERRLIDAARAAMTRRDAESCMRFVAQHRRRFENGALAEERDAVDVRCQIMGGDPAAARAAEDFRRRYPESFQLGLRAE